MFSSLFKKYQNLIYQFLRFAGIGFLNTAVDFSIINVLMTLTGVTAGFNLAIINTASFTVAVIHSYLWNKYWAFGGEQEKIGKFIGKLVLAGLVGMGVVALVVFGASQQYLVVYFIILLVVLFAAEVILWKLFGLKFSQAGSGKTVEFSLFLGVSIIGIVINSAVVGLVTGLIAPPFEINSQLWANVVKVAATLIALAWNFVGYKFFVFRK